MKYYDLKQQYTDKYNQLVEEAGIFFAFSDKQYQEGAKEGVEYEAWGMGGFIPVHKVDSFGEATVDLHEWFKEELKKVDLEDIVLYELNNHECFYTGDWSDTWYALRGLGITQEQIAEVYSKHVRNYA